MDYNSMVFMRDLVETVQTLHDAKALDAGLKDFQLTFLEENNLLMVEFFQLLRYKLALKYPIRSN